MSSETEQPAPEPRPTEEPATPPGASPTAARTPDSGASPTSTPDSADAPTPDSADSHTATTAPAPATQRSPALIATAVALPVALVVLVLVLAVLARQQPARGPLALGSVPAPDATGPACTALLPALPGSLGDYTRSELADPAPPATAAWQTADGSDRIVLRCGLERPLEFDKAAALQVVDGVNWFALRDNGPAATSTGTYYAVDRGAYIALTVPDHAGPTPLQEISDTITKILPARPITPGPLPN
jgi:hypothetical protein